MQFTPVIRNSVSIVKSLQEFSKDRNIPTKLLDFELITHETFIKRVEDDEYEKVDDASSILKKDLLNEYVEVAQEYEIKIKPLTKLKSNPSIKITISANKLKTKIFATIAKGTLFQKDKNLFKILKSIIWEKKLRANLFIDIFEKSLDKQLNKLLEILPYTKPLSKDLKFTIGLGVEPVAPVDARVEKIFEEKNENNSLIEGVNKEELVLRFYKPQDGSDGRACNGRYIKVREPRGSDSKPSINDSIFIKESEEYIEYFANDNGFVVYEKGFLSISNTLKIEGADFKSTGNIDAGKGEKDISVHIGHTKGEGEDAIGSGVQIDVKNLNVDGSIGSNVNIVTEELTIDAQTHKNSTLEVLNKADIKLHRGNLKACDAEIDILETGKVTAEKTIHIKKMLGGEAIAPIVRVDELLSNSTIIASELIEIKTINGSNNTLIIDPLSIESYHKELDRAKESLRVANEAYLKESEKLEEDLKKHTELLPRVQTFQLRVVKATKAGKAPMKQDVLRVKSYKKDASKLQERKDNLSKEAKKVEELVEKLDKLENYDLHSKVLLHTSYDGHTKVIFVDIKTQEQMVEIPEGRVESISLELNEKDEKVIKLD